MILLGISDTVITGSMVERQSGLSSGVHTQGHLMLFFSFSFTLYCLLQKEKTYLKWIMFLLFLGTLFCIFETYTRTVILGGIIFWFSYLFWHKRKLFLCLLSLSLVLIFFKFNDVKQIVMQEDVISSRSESFNINNASSGRIGIWKHNLELFAELPLTTKLIGVGLGNELKKLPGTISRIWAGSHNDYLSLMITTGIIGVLLYLMIYGSVFFFLLLAPMARELRLFGISVLISVIIMNFVSNSYIVRFQMAQLFWFLIGLLYAQSKIENRLNQPKSKSIAKDTKVLYLERI
jgi:O-antigen ligase